MYFEWWKNFFFSAERYFLITNMALKSAGALWNYTRRRILFSLSAHTYTRTSACSQRIYIYTSMQMGHCLMTQRAGRENSPRPALIILFAANKIKY